MLTDMHDRIETLIQMLPCRDSLAYWAYDAQGRLLESTSCHEGIFSLVFGTLHYLDVVAGCTQSRAPVILQGEMDLTWIVVRQYDKAAEPSMYHVMGPFYASRIPPNFSEGLPQVIADRITSERWKARFIAALRTLPTISSIVYAEYAIMLHYCVTGEQLQISDLIYPAAKALDLSAVGSADPDPRSRLLSYRRSNVLLEMLREGNPNYRAFLLPDDDVTPVRSYTDSALQNAQIACTIYTSLCVRAAIDGGLSHAACASLSDAYIRSIFLSRSVQEVNAIKAQMYEDLIGRVIRSKQNSSCSNLVQSSCDYIRTHLSEPLELDLLAERLNYSKYYLSRRFKAETGLSVSQFVRRERIALARQLLQNTELSIDQISIRCGFSARSVFSTEFTRQTGTPPAKYRREHLQT